MAGPSGGGLGIDTAELSRIGADLQQMSLRWLGQGPGGSRPRALFGHEAEAAQLSAAFPVFVQRVQEGVVRGCALLDAASTAVLRAADAFDDVESPTRGAGPR